MSADCTGRHLCDPPMPVTARGQWTCLECGKWWRTCDVLAESVSLPASALKHIKPGHLGWTTRDWQERV